MLGFIHFDRSGLKNYQVEMLVKRERVADLVRNKYVKISNPSDGTPGKVFLGRLVEGPFFLPEEVSRDSALAQTSVLRGDEFPSVPPFYAVGGIELLGELVDDKVLGANTRPVPQATVDDISSDELCTVLRLRGDLDLGSVDGYADVRFCLDSTDKAVLPRNVGIFGTVGSGKTNTAQVLIEEISSAGYSVIVVDVEGEYTTMDEPTDRLLDALHDAGMKEKGLESFRVLHPANAETSRSSGATPFTLLTARLDPFVLCELIDATEAQERCLLEIVDALSKVAGGAFSVPDSTGLKGILEAPAKDAEPYTLREIIGAAAGWAQSGDLTIRGKIVSTTGKPHISSLYALMGKLGKLNRGGAFDAKGVPALEAPDLIVAGGVTVIDVSYSSDRLKNLVIADLLRVVFDAKLSDPKLPPTMIMIEEAHTFISAERTGRMQETIEMLREIARRGRKRWLGLTFISQQPSHIPNEIFELCNTRIVHNVKSQSNLRALKLTAGDVVDEMWDLVPSLGVGQTVVSSPQYGQPIVVNMRPCRTKRQFTE